MVKDKVLTSKELLGDEPSNGSSGITTTLKDIEEDDVELYPDEEVPKILEDIRAPMPEKKPVEPPKEEPKEKPISDEEFLKELENLRVAIYRLHRPHRNAVAGRIDSVIKKFKTRF